jgi:hypothetical protein
MKNLPNHGVASFHSTEPENIIVRHCYFENGGATNGVVGLDADGAAIVLEGQRWQAVDNVIRNWARGIELFSPRADLHGLVARGNIILAVPWHGIAALTGNNTRFYDSILTDNIIEGDPGASIPFVTGMQLAQMERCTISGNRISRCTGFGIYAAHNFLKNTISGNSIFECHVGITLSAETAGTNMANNLVSANHTDSTRHTGIQVNGVDNLVAHNHVSRPDLGNFNAPAILMFAGTTNTGCAAVGNTITDANIGLAIEPGVQDNRIFDNHMTRVITPVSNNGTGTIIRDNTR